MLLISSLLLLAFFSWNIITIALSYAVEHCKARGVSKKSVNSSFLFDTSMSMATMYAIHIGYWFPLKASSSIVNAYSSNPIKKYFLTSTNLLGTFATWRSFHSAYSSRSPLLQCWKVLRLWRRIKRWPCRFLRVWHPQF